LKEDEKIKLHKIIAKRKLSQAKALRAQIILLDDEGLTVSTIASQLGIVKNTKKNGLCDGREIRN